MNDNEFEYEEDLDARYHAGYNAGRRDNLDYLTYNLRMEIDKLKKENEKLKNIINAQTKKNL